MDRILTVAAIAVVLIVILSACSADPHATRVVDTVKVNVPIPTKRVAPAELFAPIDSKPPKFISPSDPKATSALSAEGERDLRILLIDMRSRLKAWREWAEAE